MLLQDVPALIRYPPRTSPTAPSHHLSTYRLGTLLTIPLLTSLTFFWLLTHTTASLVISWELLPVLTLLLLLIILLLPIRPIRISHNGRWRFLSTLKRVSIGGLAEVNDGKFGDILMADVLTSYAKVLGDLFVVLCMFVSGKHSTGRPDRSCGGTFVVPFLISVPSLIRLRQCLIEYVRVRKSLAGGGSAAAFGWGGQHLANAAKYSSAFPVIILSALQRGYDPANLGMSEAGLFRLWYCFFPLFLSIPKLIRFRLLTVFINSLYSFYWDVTKDWDLSLFSLNSSKRSDPSHPYGLRRHRYFHTPGIYYFVIAIDLLLRCTWSFKLSPHLDHFNDLEGGIFVMELMEVFRRWVWVFLRVETEWVRNNRGPAPDDVLLGDYNGKFDED